MESAPWPVPVFPRPLVVENKRPEVGKAETLRSPGHCSRPFQPSALSPLLTHCRHPAQLVPSTYPSHLQEN